MSVLDKFLGRTAQLDIEPLRKKHLPDVMPIEQASYPRPWTPGVFQSELELVRRGERHYLAARRGGDLVGYGGVMFVVDDAHVTNIAVAARRQRERPPVCRRPPAPGLGATLDRRLNSVGGGGPSRGECTTECDRGDHHPVRRTRSRIHSAGWRVPPDERHWGVT